MAATRQLRQALGPRGAGGSIIALRTACQPCDEDDPKRNRRATPKTRGRGMGSETGAILVWMAPAPLPNTPRRRANRALAALRVLRTLNRIAQVTCAFCAAMHPYAVVSLGPRPPLERLLSRVEAVNASTS